jgi:hypothetical protein
MKKYKKSIDRQAISVVQLIQYRIQKHIDRLRDRGSKVAKAYQESTQCYSPTQSLSTLCLLSTLTTKERIKAIKLRKEDVNERIRC